MLPKGREKLHKSKKFIVGAKLAVTPSLIESCFAEHVTANQRYLLLKSSFSNFCKNYLVAFNAGFLGYF